jgi:hypothetical protein
MTRGKDGSAKGADLERAKQSALEEKLLRAAERGKFTDATRDFWNGLKVLAATGKKRKPG